MFEAFLFSLLIIAIGVALLSVRLFAGKNFVHTHVDGNKALNRKGIHCIQAQDAALRGGNPKRVNERNTKQQNNKGHEN